MDQPSVLERIAELLYERTQLGADQQPVLYNDKKGWYEAFEDQLQHGPLDDEESAVRRASGANYMLATQLLQIWDLLNPPPAQMPDRFYALDAFFDYMERKLWEGENRTADKRIIHQTARGILMLGGRPLLADVAQNDERPPLDTNRLYRRVCLLNIPIDHQREIVDGRQYEFCIYKLNRSRPVIGLAALSGLARTHFRATGRLNDIGALPQIGFESAQMLPADAYADELRACIDWAVDQQIHILCLPELSICPEGRQVLKDRLKWHGRAGRLKDLALLIAGSYHVDRYNEAPVWLIDGDGHVSERMYRKNQAFGTRVLSAGKAAPGLEELRLYAEANKLLGGEYYHIRENIISSQAVLLLRLPIGLVGILICKDFLSARYYAKYDALEPDYLFIVSMNSKGGEFVHIWQKEAKRHALSAAFYVNATQAVGENNQDTEVVFWGLPDDTSEPSRVAPQARKSRVYYRRVDQPDGHRWPLPADGLVRVLLPGSPLNFSTAGHNLTDF